MWSGTQNVVKGTGRLSNDITEHNYPLISVVIPCHNGRQWVLEAIESIFVSGYPRLEVLITDDRSSDDSVEVIFDYILQHPQHRIYLFSHANSGSGNAAAARNLATLHARGKYVCFLDQDDVYFPNRFQAAVDYLESKPDIDGCFEPYCYVLDGNSRFDGLDIGWRSIRPGDIQKGVPAIEYPMSIEPFIDLLAGTCPVHVGTITIRRKILAEVGLFPEDVVSPDTVFLLKLFARNRVRQIGTRPVEGYRIHADSFCSKVQGSPQTLIGPLDALMKSLRWMRDNGIRRENIAETERMICRKIWFYSPKVIALGRCFIGPLVGRMLLAGRLIPGLWFSGRFWKVMLRLGWAWTWA